MGIFLNGSAPNYPLVVPFTVAGSADGNDHNLVNGEMTIEQGTEIDIAFATAIDSLIESNETIVISLAGDINIGNKRQHITTINEGNIAPDIRLIAEQALQQRLVISQQAGLVTIRADIQGCQYWRYLCINVV